MEAQRSHRTVEDRDPATSGEPSPAEESDVVFGKRMQSAESEAERFGDPGAAEVPPSRADARGNERDELAAEEALRSYVDSQPQPSATEPLIDPLGEAGHAYN
jgi:hypothetical protein